MPSFQDAPYDFQLYAVAMPRDTLYRRIDRRVDQMIADGLLDEVKGLLRAGLPPDAQSMQGLGYKEMLPVIRGKMALSDAADLIKLRTRHFAKRQLTWFRRDQRIRWLPADLVQSGQAVDMICERYLGGDSNEPE